MPGTRRAGRAPRVPGRANAPLSCLRRPLERIRPVGSRCEMRVVPRALRGLALAPQVIEDLRHHAAVDLVVARDLGHDVGRAQRDPLSLRLDLRAPGTGHGTGAVGETVAPVRLDVSE